MLKIADWQKKMMTLEALALAETLVETEARLEKEINKLQNDIDRLTEKVSKKKEQQRNCWQTFDKACQTYRPECFKKEKG